MNSWEKLYRIDIEEFSNPDEYILYKLKYKKKLIKTIEKYSKNSGKILEAGCGTALVSGYLTQLGYNVCAIDKNQDVLNLAREISKDSKIIKQPKFAQMSIFDIQYKNMAFDVSFSNGVLEHFKDLDIVKILQEQLRVASFVIVGVPSSYFSDNEKMYGDERRLMESDWKKLINLAGGKLIENTGFHYYPLRKRLLEVRKYFRPKAFHLFVITKQKNNKFVKE